VLPVWTPEEGGLTASAGGSLRPFSCRLSNLIGRPLIAKRS
jgi:hypothetical protein